MSFLGPSSNRRLNEAVAVLCLFGSAFMAVSLLSYHPEDPSWNTAAGQVRPRNWFGYPGAWFADLSLQILGLASLAPPLLLVALAWKWARSKPVESPYVRLIGGMVLVTGCCAALAMFSGARFQGGVVAAGGVLGVLVAGYLKSTLNTVGAVLVTAVSIFLSLYLVSSFSLASFKEWLAPILARPVAAWNTMAARWRSWRQRRRVIRAILARPPEQLPLAAETEAELPPDPAVEPAPWEVSIVEQLTDIPIRTLEDEAEELVEEKPAPEAPRRKKKHDQGRPSYSLPDTSLLNEPPGRNAFDEQELKDIAARVKAKFEEFNVFGAVVQINPGPVVTTFEFKPEAGIKYSRITTLSEDLCLGLQAESILIERIPGKPTVGIEVPNSKREVISLRQVLESDEFQESQSRLTISLGKDISGRIRVAALETMPHLLIAGSTGSGKSVLLNTMIMSVLYKSTPEEVRMIMVDPKRLELGLYEGVPHLLTPVITDPKKATNALRNAVLEMERRLKLLAAQGVRNIEQYNRKVRQILSQPRSLFEEEAVRGELEELRPLPHILILIDELADLMMVERGGVEESVMRLAQMARAVGMHLVLATQRPSVDVITGVIKANFPARISFRVATRVDSRTILDEMGAEHLLGKGDMLFLPPGTGRKVRVHGAFVTEGEINRVVECWKSQAQPDYDQSYLAPPPSEEDDLEDEEFGDADDPMYADAVRVVCELGKASTSTLQRRLRLGYGRAARILDRMQREGIIGPPDGSRPRDVLKRPDWLDAVSDPVR